MPFRTAAECEAAGCVVEAASPARSHEAMIGDGTQAAGWAAEGPAAKPSRGVTRSGRLVRFRARTVVE